MQKLANNAVFGLSAESLTWFSIATAPKYHSCTSIEKNWINFAANNEHFTTAFAALQFGDGFFLVQNLHKGYICGSS